MSGRMSSHRRAHEATSGAVPNPLRDLDLEQLRTRTSMKWRAFPPDVLPAWVAEMDVPLAEPVARAITDAVARGDTGYPAGTDYAAALREFAVDRWRWEPEIARMRIVPDVMLGLVEVLKLLTAAGDAVVVNCPVYPPFYAFTRNAGRQVVEAPLGPDDRIDLDALDAAFRRAGAGSVYLLCSPHNPTGTVHTRDELAAVARLANERGVRVVADEIHAPLVSPRVAWTPYLRVPGAERGFALLSASKGWNLAGLKAALVVAGPEAGELDRLPEEVGHGPSHLGVLAHTAALREARGWLDDLLVGIDENRELLTRLLAEQLPEVEHRVGEATFLAWLDCRALGLDDPARAFRERGRVALSDGADFGSGGAGHVRLNLGTSPELVAEAVRRMAAVR